MADKSFTYFRSDVILSGKHARYCDALWEQNQIKNSYFQRLVDLYAFAAIIGFRAKRKSKPDTSDDDKRTIQTQQLLNVTILQDLMKLFLLTEDNGDDEEVKVNRAFRGPKTEEEFKANVDMFNDYVRGGIEILYEELYLRELDLNDAYTDKKIGNLMALLDNPLVPEIN